MERQHSPPTFLPFSPPLSTLALSWANNAFRPSIKHLCTLVSSFILPRVLTIWQGYVNFRLGVLSRWNKSLLFFSFYRRTKQEFYFQCWKQFTCHFKQTTWPFGLFKWKEKRDFADPKAWQLTSVVKVNNTMRNFFLSPMTTACPIKGKAALRCCSINTGATFSPPAVTRISLILPVMVTKPFLSTLAMSPEWRYPLSSTASTDLAGSFKYPMKTCLPSMQSLTQWKKKMMFYLII